jgi:hypothetical protein
MPKNSFIALFLKESTSFQKHVARVTSQYEAVQILKARLTKHQATIQMDFAENYTTAYHEEVQSAYYDRAQITLHPMVCAF